MEDKYSPYLTEEEKEILDLTAQVWNKYLKLPVINQSERTELMGKIHDIQRMVLARPGFRVNGLKDIENG